MERSDTAEGETDDGAGMAAAAVTERVDTDEPWRGTEVSYVVAGIGSASNIVAEEIVAEMPVDTALCRRPGAVAVAAIDVAAVTSSLQAEVAVTLCAAVRIAEYFPGPTVC